MAGVCNNRTIPEVVVFVDRSRRKKVTTKGDDNLPAKIDSNMQNTNSPKVPIISMKRARFDVHKFGISGFTKEKKEEAKIQLAVSLGAKPPKNKHYNYRDYMAMKKAQKSEEMQQLERDRALGLKVKKMKIPKSKSQKGQKSLSCQVGRYENGMQIIPRRLIKNQKQK